MLACFASCQKKEGDVSEGKPGAAKLAPVETSATAPIDVMEHETLVGQQLEQVQAACVAAEVTHRVIEMDGEPRPVTKDFRPERLNFKVEAGVVIAVTKG